MIIQMKELNIEFKLIRRKRKTMEIRIQPPGLVEVIAPDRLSKNQVLDFVASKGQWIQKKLAQMALAQDQIIERKYETGEYLLLQGKEVPFILQVDPERKTIKVSHSQDGITVTSPVHDKEAIGSVLEKWYITAGQQIVEERIAHYQRFFPMAPSKVQVKNQKRRWGTCTSGRALYFNWRIVMAPVEIIDYLVVHEMCHMLEMNHSPRYWSLVEQVLPDYKKRRKWLKENGMRLCL